MSICEVDRHILMVMLSLGKKFKGVYVLKAPFHSLDRRTDLLGFLCVNYGFLTFVRCGTRMNTDDANYVSSL